MDYFGNITNMNISWLKFIRKELPVVILVSCVVVPATWSIQSTISEPSLQIGKLKEEIDELKGEIKGLCTQISDSAKSTPVRLEKKVTLPIPAGGLFIFKNQSDAEKSGQNKDSFYILGNNDNKPITESVDFSETKNLIESLDFKVSYKYDANSRFSPVSFDLILKDEKGETIKSSPVNIQPEETKKKLEYKGSLGISKEFQGKRLTIEAKPSGAGDYGFYIYSIDINVITNQKVDKPIGICGKY